MIISMSNPIIAYSKKGDDFKYDRLFIQTVRQYIIDHKNAEYDRLTDKDKSIVLAKLIKNMYVNGVPVVEFFKEQIAAWSDKDNFEKNKLVIEMISKEIFGCYDKNLTLPDGDFYKSPYLFAIQDSMGNFDYFEPEKPAGLFGKLFSKKDTDLKYYNYYQKLREWESANKLPKTPIELVTE